ncbi:RNA-directed DNA polymerase, eukaryota [Tanacetum coccineum]
MITFLKNMGRFTYNQLKNKSLEEIQKLYEREQKWINDFVPMDSKMVKDSGKKDDDSQKQAESSKKKPRAKHDEESVKKQKLKDDAEKEELRAYLDIVPMDDIDSNVESLATKYPIVDWKTHSDRKHDITHFEEKREVELKRCNLTLWLNKNATVSSKMNASSLDNSFRRKTRSGIEEMQLNSLAEISRMTTLVSCEDRYVWTLESDGVFSVASIRKEIDGNRFQDVSLPTRWVKSVPIKVNIIAWKVKSNALPTRFNISRRGMDIDSIVCPICNAGVESTNHIFFQCVVVRQIMRKISSWWNIDYSDVNSYEEWRVWLVSIRIQSKLKGVLEGVYYGLWWYMWNFRNKLLFDKKIPEKALIFDNLVSSSFYWCKFRCKASFKWDDWLKNPYIVLV